MSASELAGGLDLRLNTLKYHLDALLDSGLTRVTEVRWSQKGRKIKVYEPVEKMIVLIPRAGLKAVPGKRDVWQISVTNFSN